MQTIWAQQRKERQGEDWSREKQYKKKLVVRLSTKNSKRCGLYNWRIWRGNGVYNWRIQIANGAGSNSARLNWEKGWEEEPMERWN